MSTFLQRKEELRNVEEIPRAELNELLSAFVLTVKTQGGNDYELTLLRGMIASFERFLKRKVTKIKGELFYTSYCIRSTLL